MGESQSLMVVQWFDTMIEQLSCVDTPPMKATLSLNVWDAKAGCARWFGACSEICSPPMKSNFYHSMFGMQKKVVPGGLVRVLKRLSG